MVGLFLGRVSQLIFFLLSILVQLLKLRIHFPYVLIQFLSIRIHLTLSLLIIFIIQILLLRDIFLDLLQETLEIIIFLIKNIHFPYFCTEIPL